MEKLRAHLDKHCATYLVGLAAVASATTVIVQMIIVNRNGQTHDHLNASIAQERANGDCWHGMLHDYLATNPLVAELAN